MNVSQTGEPNVPDRRFLLAPASVRETRQTVAEEVEKAGRYLVTLGHDARDEVVHIAQSSKRITHRVTHL